MKKYEVTLDTMEVSVRVDASSPEAAVNKVHELLLYQLPDGMAVMPKEDMKIATNLVKE